jgi:hypothetical protein
VLRRPAAGQFEKRGRAARSSELAREGRKERRARHPCTSTHTHVTHMHVHVSERALMAHGGLSSGLAGWWRARSAHPPSRRRSWQVLTQEDPPRGIRATSLVNLHFSSFSSPSAPSCPWPPWAVVTRSSRRHRPKQQPPSSPLPFPANVQVEGEARVQRRLLSPPPAVAKARAARSRRRRMNSPSISRTPRCPLLLLLRLPPPRRRRQLRRLHRRQRLVDAPSSARHQVPLPPLLILLRKPRQLPQLLLRPQPPRLPQLPRQPLSSRVVAPSFSDRAARLHVLQQTCPCVM